MPPQPPAPSGADAWPAWVAPVGLVAGLIGAFVGGLMVVVLAQAFGADVGDSLDADVAGARAAGIEPVLVVRDGAAPVEGVRTIASLSSLVPR